MESLALMISSSVNAGTILALAALGLLINERAGVVNLGAEGMMLVGGLAGLAGAFEVAGPLGQLTPHLPVGYGFAAIIVAFVGRLHPLGVLLSSALMSLFYIGGELAQSRLGLPKALTGVFQGLLLFALLGCDALAQRARGEPAGGA